eukprot:gene34021-43954_t
MEDLSMLVVAHNDNTHNTINTNSSNNNHTTTIKNNNSSNKTIGTVSCVRIISVIRCGVEAALYTCPSVASRFFLPHWLLRPSSGGASFVTAKTRNPALSARSAMDVCGAPAIVYSPPPSPPPPPVLVAGTAQQTLVPPQTFECMSCSDPAIPLSERYAISADCSPASSNCRSCVAGWLASQIDGGNAAALTCPCGGRHKVRYANIRDLGSLLPNRSLEIYSRAMRSAASSAPVGVPSLMAVSCPDCDAEYQAACCCGGGTQVPPPRCTPHIPVFDANLRGLEEASGNVAVMEAKTSIRDAFDDRCPACRGVVGEPESFDNCMCLNCRYNDRRNFYCPEPLWRDLMRQRRLRLVDNILNAPALDLTAAQKDELRQWAATLL